MPISSYPNGFPGGLLLRGLPMYDTIFGRAWFVDAKTGSDGNIGNRRDRPFATMSKAFSVIDSGDIIIARGKIREELTAPAGVFDVTVIGAANRPRHADDHTESNGARGSSAATWMPPASPTAATPLCIVQQQGWRFINMLFDCPVDAAAVQLLRNADSSSDERDASHAEFVGCRFTSGLIGIQNNGGAGFVRVQDCNFYALSGSGAAGIKCTSTSVAVPLNWQILNSHFANNASHILSSMSYSLIKGNTFGRFTATLAVDIDDQPSSNQGEYNVITENYLTGTYGLTAYPAGTNNEWAGNKNVAGETTSDPA